MKYRAICFDIDGTLYPMKFLKKCGLAIALKHPFVSSDYKKLRAEFRRIQDDGDKEFDRLSFTEKEAVVYSRVVNPRLTPEMARLELDDKYYTYLRKEFSKLGFVEATRSTLERIKAKGLKIGVFSDWPLFDKLKRIGVEDLCDVVSNPETSGFLKPSAKAFREMIEKIGISPDMMLYVGDSYKKDVLGAGRAGMDAVLVNCNDPTSGKYPEAVKVCRNWEEFDTFVTTVLED